LAKTVPTPFSWTLRIYWEDTDAGGIVFYANYLKFFERARTEWLRSLGIEQQALRAQSGGMFIVSQTQVRHLLPCRLDDEIIVTAGLLESGRASMTIQQQAFLKTPGQAQLLAEASIRIGWVNATSLKPARLPASILDRLENRT
jgi:acyl-CoA thioester hydrolase